MGNFKVVTEKTENVLTVKVRGHLDVVNASELEAYIQPELGSVSQIVMDLEEVEYVSSAGLRVLLAAQQKMESKGGGMTLIHVSPVIREIFEMTGFLDMVALEE